MATPGGPIVFVKSHRTTSSDHCQTAKIVHAGWLHHADSDSVFSRCLRRYVTLTDSRHMCSYEATVSDELARVRDPATGHWLMGRGNMLSVIDLRDAYHVERVDIDASFGFRLFTLDQRWEFQAVNDADRGHWMAILSDFLCERWRSKHIGRVQVLLT